MYSLNPHELLEIQEKVSAIVQEASIPARKNWNAVSQYRLKPDKSPVTEIDTLIENSLIEKLSKILPNAGFIVEEGTTKPSDNYNWVIDPIDQTKNFIFRLPLFYIQVALILKDEPVLGVIYNPVADQMFAGSKGNGVIMNGSKLKLNEDVNPYIDLDFGSMDGDNEWKLMILSDLTKKNIKYRLTGASYSPYILTNAIEGYLVLNQQTKLVDQYPRLALMRAYGLKAEMLTLKHKNTVIAARENLYNILNDILLKNII